MFREVSGYRCGLALGFLFLVIASGCGPEGPKGATGTVHGTITGKDGKPVSGTVYFNSTSGSGGLATLQADGSYKLGGQFGEKIPVGDYKVSVSPAGGTGADIAATPTGALGGGPIPAKYLSSDTSGWTAPVKEGDNTFDFKIE